MLKYWLWLATRKGLGAHNAYLIARHFPSVEAAFYAGREAYEQVHGLTAIEPLLDKDLTQPQSILRQCYEEKISILTMQDASYPKRLLTLEDAPVVLYCKGTLPDLNGPVIGVVGTRKATVYGMTQARNFSYGLSSCGCIVVSGGAAGIDTEAIRGALLGGSPAVAVLGCGVDVDYPKYNGSLFRQLEQNGCLLSEYPPKTPPYASNFPQRNRIISGLSVGVLVTEAPAKSGALITADHALEQGRDVFVLPANVGVDAYGGNLKLLREGAIPVTECWDILQEYVSQYPHVLKKREETVPEIEPQIELQNEPVEKKVIDKPKGKVYIDLMDKMDNFSSEEQSLLRLLHSGPQHIDMLVEQTNMTAGSALASLTLLEVKGIVTRPSARMYELAEK